MIRCFFIAVVLAAATVCGQAAAHDPHDTNPLACDRPAGETCYVAHLDHDHTPLSPHHDAAGQAFLVLNSERTELRYSIDVEGLDLDPIEANRTASEDITGIHLHLSIPGTIGPHVLNIFGWPAEEDADAVFDFDHESMTGIFDISDVSIDPATGQPYLQNLPLTTKIIYNWLDELDDGELMVAVHTVATGFGVMAIHGHINRVVPEPATSMLLVSGLLPILLRTRKRRIISRG
jgi:hypothetical protein